MQQDTAIKNKDIFFLRKKMFWGVEDARTEQKKRKKSGSEKARKYLHRQTT